MFLNDFRRYVWEKCKDILEEHNDIDTCILEYDKILEHINLYQNDNYSRKLLYKEYMTNYFNKYRKSFYNRVIDKNQKLGLIETKFNYRLQRKIKDYYSDKTGNYGKYKDYYSYDVENDHYWDEYTHEHDYDYMFSSIEDDDLYVITGFYYSDRTWPDEKKKKQYLKRIIRQYNRLKWMEDEFMFIFKYTEYYRIGVDIRYKRIRDKKDFGNRKLDDLETFYLIICPKS